MNKVKYDCDCRYQVLGICFVEATNGHTIFRGTETVVQVLFRLVDVLADVAGHSHAAKNASKCIYDDLLEMQRPTERSAVRECLFEPCYLALGILGAG